MRAEFQGFSSGRTTDKSELAHNGGGLFCIYQDGISSTDKETFLEMPGKRGKRYGTAVYAIDMNDNGRPLLDKKHAWG
jgi:hypothetical protein